MFQHQSSVHYVDNTVHNELDGWSISQYACWQHYVSYYVSCMWNLSQSIPGRKSLHGPSVTICCSIFWWNLVESLPCHCLRLNLCKFGSRQQPGYLDCFSVDWSGEHAGFWCWAPPHIQKWDDKTNRFQCNAAALRCKPSAGSVSNWQQGINMPPKGCRSEGIYIESRL